MVSDYRPHLYHHPLTALESHKSTEVDKTPLSWYPARRFAAAALALTCVSSTACSAASAGSTSGLAIPDQVEGIPDVVLRAYGEAVAAVEDIAPKCTGLTWGLLAGIGQEESHHGVFYGGTIGTDGTVTPPIIGVALNGGVINDRGDTVAAISDTDNGHYDNDTRWDRAVGPMQFIPGTWAKWAPDANPDATDPDPQNIFHATRTTAAYLCGKGEVDLTDRTTLEARVRAYNNSSKYVADVIAHMEEYNAIPVSTQNDYGASGAAAIAISWALQHEGAPYVFGGDCLNPQQALEGARRAPSPNDSKNQCDCSSLVQQAYKAAGVALTRTTYTQFDQADLRAIEPINGRGSTLSDADLAALKPGDLLYFNSEGAPGPSPTHVGMYLGGREMVHAPNSDRDIEVIDMVEDRGGYYMGSAQYWGARQVTG